MRDRRRRGRVCWARGVFLPVAGASPGVKPIVPEVVSLGSPLTPAAASSPVPAGSAPRGGRPASSTDVPGEPASGAFTDGTALPMWMVRVAVSVSPSPSFRV